MYADFRLPYRPRPLRWRIALVSICTSSSLTITNGLVSLGDIAILRTVPKMPDAWVVYITPCSR